MCLESATGILFFLPLKYLLMKYGVHVRCTEHRITQQACKRDNKRYLVNVKQLKQGWKREKEAEKETELQGGGCFTT